MNSKINILVRNIFRLQAYHLVFPMLLIAGKLYSQNVGIGTNAPTALLHAVGNNTGGGNVLFQGIVKTQNPGPPPASGGGTRMMWYPDKAAFRAGTSQFNEWDESNIGPYSAAFGLTNAAIGGASLSSGFFNIASGQASVALGNYCTASGNYTIALGNYTNASGISAIAMGDGTKASGTTSTAMGLNTKAEAFRSTAIGYYNIGGGNPTSTVATDPLFEIGNGTVSVSNNAFTVLKNGRIGINMHNPNAQLDITAPAINVTGLRVAFGNSIKLDLNPNGGLSVGGYGFVAPDNGLLVYGRGVIGNKLMIGAIETPVTTLHIRHAAINSGTAPVEGIRIQNTGANLHFWTLYTVNSNGNLTLYSKTSGNAAVGNFNAGTGAYTATSNRHLKTNVQLLDADVLTRIQQLQPATYSYIRDPLQQRTIGFMAEDVQPIFPELVDTIGENGENIAINYAGFSVVAIKAIQMLTEEVNELQQQVKELQKKFTEK